MGLRLDLAQPVTDADLQPLSAANPGYQFERTAEGVLLVSPTGGESGRRSGEVFAQLHAWNRTTGRGVVFDRSTGFHLPDGACLSPDATWLAGERWLALTPAEREGFPPLCPDAVFAVRSATDTPQALQDKLQCYLANGARLPVLVDPYARRVTLSRPHQPIQVREAPDTVPLDPELPGFALACAPLWAEDGTL
ncbi:MAG: Uma2 family endonuclease [Actinomycetia bacterium]|nr:Uma2 family endonuclease [Actinomycetes bacterium]